MQNALDKKNTGIPIAVLTIIVFLVPFLKQITDNSLMKLVEDGAYFLMLLFSIYLLKRNNPYIQINPMIMVLVFSLLTFALIGIYYSGIGVVILQFREFKYLFLLVILLPYNKSEDYKYVWPMLKVIATICVPVSIVQWIVLHSIADDITGIMGYKQSGTLSLFLLIVFFTEFSRRLIKKQKFFGYYFLYLIPTLINETKITLLLLPVMLLVSLYLSKNLKLQYIITIFVFLIVFTTGYSILYNGIGYDKSFGQMFSYEGLKTYFMASGDDWGVDAGRLTKVLMAFNFIKDNPFFGFGLGASYGGATSGLNGYIYTHHSGGTQLDGTRPQVVLSLIDLGILGTCIVVFLLIVFLVKVLSSKNLTMEKILAINSSLIVLVAFPYQQIFYSYQLMFIFTMFTCLCLRSSSDSRKYEVETLSTFGA